MKTSTLLATLTLTFLMSLDSFGQCADSINIYAFSYNGSNYELIRENITWEGAAACALGRGGYLAEVNDAAENVAIFTELTTNAGITESNTVAPDGGGGAYVWIGGNDIVTEGEWIWDGDNTGVSTQFWQGTSSGNPVGGLYSNWGNEPDNFNEQDALGFSINGWPLGLASEWNDVDHLNQLHYLIEYPSTAGTNELENKFEIYPNPIEDLIHIKSDVMISTVILRSCLGQEMMRFDLQPSSDIEISVADLLENVYLLEIVSTDGSSVVRKLMK